LLFIGSKRQKENDLFFLFLFYSHSSFACYNRDLRKNGNTIDNVRQNLNGVPKKGESDIDDDEHVADEEHDIRGSDDDEQEDPKDYCKGGYHPISIGSVFNQRYHVIRKLGWGKSSR
jgi:hypothetical protein